MLASRVMSGNRREFCQQLVYTGFGAYLAVATGACRRREDKSALVREKPSFLTPLELQTVSAACERMLPADEDPGAIALGVPTFVDRQLATDTYAKWRDQIRKDLADLDLDARARFGTTFAHLSASDQDTLLATWSIGNEQQTTFLSRLMYLTVEGAFSDPVHGGNKDGAGWTLIGFAPSQPRPMMGHHHM